jgi:hypothetical protein
MDGLPRRDVPPRLQNALLPGHVPPTCRRQRAVLGKTNRPGHQAVLAAEATAVLLGRGSVQQRASSSLGVRRSGSPFSLSMTGGGTVRAMGLSDTTGTNLAAVVARSMTPVLPVRRYTPSPALEQHGEAVVAAVHQRGVLPELRNNATPYAEPGRGAASPAEASADMALAAPQRPSAAIPSQLRRQLLQSPEPMQASAANTQSVQRVRQARSALAGGSSDVTGMLRFLRNTDARNVSEMPAVDPLQAPYVVKPQLRQDIVDYHPTDRITACPEGTGMYASTQARFDAATRAALGHSSVGLSEKAARHRHDAAHAQRVQGHTQHIHEMIAADEQRSIERAEAGRVKRAALRTRTAAHAAELQHGTGKRRGATESNTALFLPEY